jgi:hypothetical protein
MLVILVAVAVKSSPEGGEDMIKKVYVYLVLFATLMMVIGGSVAAFMAVADIIAPSPYYQSYEEFRRYGNEKIEGPDGELIDQELTEPELKEKYEEMIKSYEEQEIRRAKNSLIKSFGWIVIPLPIFIFFQKKLTQ